MKIAFGINSVGLGHATRSIPIIDALIKKKHKVHIISSGRPLQYLKLEYPTLQMFDIPDYSFPEHCFTEKGYSILNLIKNFPLYTLEIKKEEAKFKELESKHKYDMIISDTKLGMWSKHCPSYILFHHFKLYAEEKYKVLDRMIGLVTKNFAKKYKKIFIPDFKTHSLGGAYTHDLPFNEPEKFIYTGHLSMVKKKNIEKDIDYFFSISGPEPLRTTFEKKTLECITQLKNKKIVVTLGKPEKKETKKMKNITIHNCLGKEAQQNILNRSKLIITRSGYSTVMDLAEIESQALFIPTKGQPEQEYLAKYHLKKKHFLSKKLENLKLPEDLLTAKTYKGYKPKHKTKKSVEIILNHIFENK